MMRAAIAFAYDGALFASFARQPRRRTVEGELIATLVRTGAMEDPRRSRFGVASRTDRGVSAWWNVCAFDTALDPRGLSHVGGLPPGLWLLAAARVPDGFSPRRAATSRSYVYRVEGARSLDWRAAAATARLFVGRHDLRNFCRREPGVATVRRLHRVRIGRRGDDARIGFEAPSFLWEQVRRMVHAILGVAKGERGIASVRDQLAGAGGPEPPAPPEPLVLERVDVPVNFLPVSKRQAARIRADAASQRMRSFYAEGLAASLPRARR